MNIKYVKDIGKLTKGMLGIFRGTKNPVRAKKIFSRDPASNIGIRCGKISGIVGLDIDKESEFDQIISDFALPKTLTVKTPTGYHLYYAYPEGVSRVSSSARKIHRYIDVKGDYSYLVMPPSKKSQDKHYTWVNEGHRIEALPQQLLEKINAVPHMGYDQFSWNSIKYMGLKQLLYFMVGPFLRFFGKK